MSEWGTGSSGGSHPTEHGQPAAKGIDAVRHAAMKPHPGK
jgi:hypothetical protein